MWIVGDPLRAGQELSAQVGRRTDEVRALTKRAEELEAIVKKTNELVATKEVIVLELNAQIETHKSTEREQAGEASTVCVCVSRSMHVLMSLGLADTIRQMREISKSTSKEVSEKHAEVASMQDTVRQLQVI